MHTKEHKGRKYRTRKTHDGFIAYVDGGTGQWWRVNRGITYTTREWAERQAKWAIEDVKAGRKSGLSVLS